MLAPEFLYQFTGAKDAVVQQLEVVHRSVDANGLAAAGFILPCYTVPDDRVFCMTHAAVRTQLTGGLPAVLNTVVQMQNTGALSLRYFIAQDETEIPGLGSGRYRGIVNWSGEAWFTSRQIISAVGSWGPVVDDWLTNITISGITFPRASVTLG